MDYSLPGSSAQEISQARILEWAAILLAIHLIFFTLNSILFHINV